MAGFWETRETAKLGGISGLGLSKAEAKRREQVIREKREADYERERLKGLDEKEKRYKHIGSKRLLNG